MPKGPMHPHDRWAIAEGMRRYYEERSEAEAEAHRQRAHEAALIRNATFRLNPDPGRNRGHRYEPGHTLGNGNTKDRYEAILVARTLKELAWRVYKDNPEMIYDAIVNGVRAEPPRSIPYLAMILRCEEDLMDTASASGLQDGWSAYLSVEEHEYIRTIMNDPKLQSIMSAARARAAGQSTAPAVIDVSATEVSSEALSKGGTER